MRGKAERAKAGKIPQGIGIGCYGYTYDRETGTRTVASPQATVIREIFSDFLSGVPIVSITNHLNGAGVPTFSGSKCYPVSIHNVLRNVTYTGRKKRLVTKRDPSEWIEILGATPMIIEPAIFEAVQRILDDPERRRRGRRLHNYFLSGRIKCLKCGKAMVGQTLQGRYRYYRCRRAFAGPKHDRCPTAYSGLTGWNRLSGPRPRGCWLIQSWC